VRLTRSREPRRPFFGGHPGCGVFGTLTA